MVVALLFFRWGLVLGSLSWSWGFSWGRSWRWGGSALGELDFEPGEEVVRGSGDFEEGLDLRAEGVGVDCFPEDVADEVFDGEFDIWDGEFAAGLEFVEELA